MPITRSGTFLILICAPMTSSPRSNTLSATVLPNTTTLAAASSSACVKIAVGHRPVAQVGEGGGRPECDGVPVLCSWMTWSTDREA